MLYSFMQSEYQKDVDAIINRCSVVLADVIADQSLDAKRYACLYRTVILVASKAINNLTPSEDFPLLSFIDIQGL